VKKTPEPRSRTAAFLAAMRRLRGRGDGATGPALDVLPCIPVAAEDVRTLAGPEDFRETLLQLIAGARQRILLSALYLQDDDAGRQVLAALYAARSARPELQIAVFVDWHRAQRGLIGQAASAGNAALYTEMAVRLGAGRADLRSAGAPARMAGCDASQGLRHRRQRALQRRQPQRRLSVSTAIAIASIATI
jgi:CDP-diacylglycerol--serine O-phosphatidyltransferase